MVCREGGVKWLDAKPFRIAGERGGGHERHRTEAADIPIVQGASVGEGDLEGGVAAFALVERSIVDQQRTRESRLYDQRVATRQLEDDELRAAPGPGYGGPGQP